MLARPANGSLHIGERFAEDDRLWLVRVEAGVVEDAGLVVGSVAAHDHGPAHGLRELVEDSGRRRPGEVDDSSGDRHGARSDERVLASADEQLSARHLFHAPNLAIEC